MEWREEREEKQLECVRAEARVTLSHPVVSLLVGLSCCAVPPHPVVLMFDFQTAKSKQGHETSPWMKDGEGRGGGGPGTDLGVEMSRLQERPDQSGDGSFLLKTIRHPAKTPDVSGI